VEAITHLRGPEIMDAAAALRVSRPPMRGRTSDRAGRGLLAAQRRDRFQPGHYEDAGSVQPNDPRMVCRAPQLGPGATTAGLVNG
jgi:hypothetical protein